MTPNEPIQLLESAQTLLPTEWGNFTVSAFGTGEDRNHLLLLYGRPDPQEPLLVRVHSECITSEVFGSLKCDCRAQLQEAIRTICAAGSGAIVYLRQEGRGIGLFNKIESYRLQEQGLDTIQANLHLNLAVDDRDYSLAHCILQAKGFGRVRLITNNYDKVEQLRRYGTAVSEVVPTTAYFNPVNAGYIHTKISQLGHKYLQHDLA